MSDELDDRLLEDREAQEFARWAAAPLFSFGFLAPVPFLVASARTGARRYVTAAAIWTVAVLACIVALVLGEWAAAGVLVLLNALGATVHTLAIRRGVARVAVLDRAPEIVAAERAADLRGRARTIAERDPQRALELGVGRPDLDGAFDGGLIDVNHAPPEVLQRLPGIDAARARRVVELRMNGTGFVSAEDLDMVLDLDPGEVREIAARAVFLPRY